MSDLRVMTNSAWLALRNLVWAALLPGFAAGYLPWRLFGSERAAFDPHHADQLLGAIAILAGMALLASCIVEFARRGRGTLSPADPPKTLVVAGLYRYVRNPMYLAVSVILLGEAASFRSLGLLAYWAVWFVIVNLFVMAYEEPTLRRQFGADFERYCRRVGRWLPRLRPAV